MITIWILPLALSGFAVSWYIYRTKRKHKKLVCIIGKDCNRVVESKYNTLLGIPNEILGLLYYAFVILLVLGILLEIERVGPVTLLFALVASGFIAAFFSTVLLIIQAFMLRKWCEYCIVSAGISIAIFILEIL
jgi:uncharacterized membrane protein